MHLSCAKPSYLPVLLILLMNFFSFSISVPVVFPSLTKTQGFVYVEEDDKVVSIPAAVDPLLCSQDRREDFEPANKPCSDLIIFTSTSFITFRVLNLSSTGVIQPITTIPEVRSSHRGIPISWRRYGASGRINADEDQEDIEDDSSVDLVTIPLDIEPEPAPELELDLESTPAPNTAEEPMSNDIEFQEVRPLDDEQEENSSVNQLEADIPQNVEGNGRDAIEGVVLEANETSGFLNPDGTIVDGVAMVLEMEAQGLPEKQLLTLNFDFGFGVERSLMIYLDSSTATATIRSVTDNEENDEEENTRRKRRDRYTFEVRFSKLMLNAPEEEDVTCPDLAEPLNLFSSENLGDTSQSLRANDLTAMIVASREFQQCDIRLDEFEPESLVEVKGVSPSLRSRPGKIRLDRLERGKGVIPSVVTVEFSVERGRRKRVTIHVDDSHGVTLSGAPVRESSETYRVGRRSERTQDSITRGEQLGTASTAVVSSSVATSVTTSVGVSIAASVSGSAATGGVGGATAGGSMSGAVEFLQFGQKVYLISRLSVPNLPENFVAYGNSLSWTMMDIRTPWSENSEESSEQERPEESEDRDEEDKEQEEERRNEKGSKGANAVEAIVGDDGYERVVRAFTWTGFLFLCLILLHAALIAFFFRRRLGLPSALRLPRLELYFAYWCIPAIAGSSASLLTGNNNQKTLGIILLLVFPLPFVLWHVYIIIRHFLSKSPEHLKVVYELEYKSATKPSPESSGGASTSDGSKNEPKEATVNEKGTSFLERYLISPILGPPYRAGKWATIEGPANKFIDRYGPAFEDYRGIPGLRRNATFLSIEDSKKIQRGQFTPLSPHLRYPIDRTQLSYVFKVCGTLLQLIRMIFISCFILGAENPKSNNQTITLFVLSAVYLLLLRLFRPHCARWKLGVAMATEILDVCTYMCVLYLINNDSTEEDNIRRNLGIIMLALEGLGFFLVFIEQGFSSLSILRDTVVATIEQYQKPPKAVEVFTNAQLHNPRYLERKYFNIWVSKTLGKGLYSGIVKRDRNAPFEEMFWVYPWLAIRRKLFNGRRSNRRSK